MPRISVLELPARWDAVDVALADVDQLLTSGGPTDLAILPEMSFTGYVSPEADWNLTRFAEPLDGPTVRAVATLAERHATSIVAPLVLAEGGELYNAAVVVGPDRSRPPLAVYRKRHPWFPETWATPGRGAYPLFHIGPLTVTIAICFDGHFLEDEAAALLPLVDLLVFTSAWVDDEDTRVPLLRSLTKQFGVAVANANWAPGVVVVPGQGSSCVLDAQGDVVASVEPSSGRRADAVIHPRR